MRRLDRRSGHGAPRARVGIQTHGRKYGGYVPCHGAGLRSGTALRYRRPRWPAAVRRGPHAVGGVPRRTDLVRGFGVGRRCVKSFAAAIAFLVATGMQAAANPLSSQQIKAIDGIAAQALAKQHVSGLEIGVGRAGRVLYARGYGLRDRAANLPVTAATVFPVGSITKQFTAACVMLLVQRGKLDLGARVSAYLPDAPHAREITVRELLDQTSGLPDYLDDKSLLASILSGKARPDSVERFVSLVEGKPLHFQ